MGTFISKILFNDRSEANHYRDTEQKLLDMEVTTIEGETKVMSDFMGGK
jgi:hypothetical protein